MNSLPEQSTRRPLRLSPATGLVLLALLPACAYHGPTEVYDPYGPAPYAAHASPLYGDVKLVFDADLGCHLVHGRPHHYFQGDRYYRHQGGHWEVGQRAGGPWRRADVRQLPPRLRRHYHRPRAQPEHGHRTAAKDRRERGRDPAEVRRRAPRERRPHEPPRHARDRPRPDPERPRHQARHERPGPAQVSKPAPEREREPRRERVRQRPRRERNAARAHTQVARQRENAAPERQPDAGARERRERREARRSERAEERRARRQRDEREQEPERPGRRPRSR
jgi:hypothetical protein